MNIYRPAENDININGIKNEVMNINFQPSKIAH